MMKKGANRVQKGEFECGQNIQESVQRVRLGELEGLREEE
jgi:hypothetical protein